MLRKILPLALLCACYPKPPQINVEVEIERTNGEDTAAEEEEAEEEEEDSFSAPERQGPVDSEVASEEACEACSLYCACEMDSSGMDDCTLEEACSEACELDSPDSSLWFGCMEGQTLSSCGAILDGSTCGEPGFR